MEIHSSPDCPGEEKAGSGNVMRVRVKNALVEDVLCSIKCLVLFSRQDDPACQAADGVSLFC